MGVMDEVKDKLRKEATEPYTKAIAEYLIKVAETNEDLRSMILDQSKTMAACFTFIKGKAKTMAKNGCACVRNDIVYEWAVEYYGMPASELGKVITEEEEETEIEKPIQKSVVPKVVAKKEKPAKEEIAGQMDLFSFLG